MRLPLILSLMIVSHFSFADEMMEKKWELGLGVGDIYGPDYRGSDEYRNYVSPIPYVIYRGKYIQSDREGLRGKIFRSDRYEFTASATATISQRADENKARESMPELGSTLEIGPALNIQLTEKNIPHALLLQIPLRAVFAVTGTERGYSGLVFEPQFTFRKKFKHWDYSQRVGVSFANNDYHDHYYSVNPEFVTPERNFYDAHGGYSGAFAQAAISRSLQFGNEETKAALFLRYENIGNTAFADSPLVKTNHVLRGGFAFIWVIRD